MVKSIPSPVLASNAAPTHVEPIPSEEELVAITVAVEAYIAAETRLLYIKDMQAAATVLENQKKNVSPWMVAGRLEASQSSAPFHSPESDNRKKSSSSAGGRSVWRNFFCALTVAGSIALTAGSASVQAAAPQSRGNADTTAGSSNSASNNAGSSAGSNLDGAFGNVFKSPYAGAKNQTVRVLIGWPSSKVDLDLPDGGSIYASDGSLVARVGPRSSWTLNLASSGTGRRSDYAANSRSGGRYGGGVIASGTVSAQRLVFNGKTSIDVAQTQATNQNLGFGSIQRAAYLPANAANFAENRFALPALRDDLNGGYMVIPAGDGSAGAVPLVGVGGKLYRGCLILRPIAASGGATTSIAAINVVKIEDYLLSVVPSEVPSLWPQEVLKAQAIAARSYVVANLGKHRADGYDVKDTVEDQVYRGVASETIETNVACAVTAGLVLKQNAQVISAFFHSTSGGSTELAENVWSKPLPYLKSVPDYDDAAPLFTWQRSFSVAQLNKSLGFNPDISEQLTGFFVVSRYKSDSQRVRHVVASSTGGGRLLTGSEVRKLLNLPSTQFSVYQADGAYVFSGRGFGHGLGLSQWGAKALADKGYNAGQILSYYYKDVTIESIGDLSGPNGSI
ncbi:MAG: SpoIID/LytB domain-containing protein [Cyanobacteria bacterium REEB67]|nr:SpoIID/LytB domain-containing protein [Cyanobacteria bacterium REEB67]